MLRKYIAKVITATEESKVWTTVFLLGQQTDELSIAQTKTKFEKIFK